MNIETYNDWYVRTDGRLGPWTVSSSNPPTSEQIYNATKIYNYFNALGWSLSAICGMIGNMMHESTIDPAFIQATNRSTLPNSAANLSDVPNNVMLSFYGTGHEGIGLVQWDGNTSTPPAGQKLVSFAERYNYIWYDGDCQVFRIKREQETNIQWTSHTYYGITWTWTNYITNTRTPEESAHIWRRCYEVAEAGDTESGHNARWFYDYFSGGPTPPTPDDWITGTDFSTLAVAYDPDITGVPISYNTLDCFGFLQKVWRDITVVGSSGRLVKPNSPPLTNGTNSLWRENVSPYPSYTFNTESPDAQNPCPVLWYKDSISNCISLYGDLPAGAVLFHQISESGPPAIPSYYEGDGIGNFAHVGIYIGNNQVMQSGGRDASSNPFWQGGVHRSTYDPTAWNYVAFVVYVDPTGSGPTPPTPPEFPNWLLLWYNTNKRKVIKNVKRFV